jgi:hypothetical protein
MRRRGQEIGRGVRDSKSYFQICDPTVSCVIMAFWDHIEIHRSTQCSQLSIIYSRNICQNLGKLSAKQRRSI